MEWEISIVNVQLTNVQQLCDLIMSVWTKITEFRLLHESLESMKMILLVGGNQKRAFRGYNTFIYLFIIE